MNLDRSSVSVSSHIYRNTQNHKQTIDQTENRIKTKALFHKQSLGVCVCVCEHVLNMLEHKWNGIQGKRWEIKRRKKTSIENSSKWEKEHMIYKVTAKFLWLYVSSISYTYTIDRRKINEFKKTIIITGNAHMRYEYYKRWGERNRDRANLAFKLITFTYSLNSKNIF